MVPPSGESAMVLKLLIYSRWFFGFFCFSHFTIATIAAIAAMVRLRGLGLCCAAFAGLRLHLHVAAGAARRQGLMAGLFENV